MNAKIYMAACMKGGCAKTVTTYNLAYSLNELGKKVLCVDFDSQANLSTCFGVEDTAEVPVTIGHLMMAQIEDEELPAPEEYIMSRKGVDFISSSMVLSAVDAKLRLEMGAEKMLSSILEPLRDRYDAIIIDTAPTLGALNINALAAADEVIIKDVYEPSAMEGRYDYILADSSAGVTIIDDKFSYSFHATDPACGQLLNAFDVVRVHKFPDDDPKKSFKAMAKFASGDEEVKLLIFKEKQDSAAEDFDEEDPDAWKKKLEYEDKSLQLKNTLRNLTLILENDPKLKDIVFNQHLDGMEIKGSVPWKHPSKFWRDADDAQLISYVDENYGTFSQRNYDIAVAKVTDDRSYHPIREFLQALPEWDRVERVDTLLIDYLGAADNKYVRAVTRKTLCAAACRVLNPGCKFDTMLVLNGSQGIGKSTLIAKLGGEWFSDSLSLNDTKDKTAAEKLQGYWILEIGELAGLRKAEVETLRSFLSRQNDIYRASFGKRTTPHPRQCVFFGTTNAESGYLRDTTGNRRFWPVKTLGGGSKCSWDITQEEVLQIWAEVMHYVKAGEKLYLDPEVEALAKAEQREAMESDEREGLVREYLEALLPDNWDDMDTFERRNFLDGTGKADIGKKGTVRRTQVCNMEIWCECFGKERSNLKRADSNELSGILVKLGWVRLDLKERVANYGPQFIFVPKECN